MKSDRTDLPQEDIPTTWYNILADMPEPLPPYREIGTEKEVRRLPETYTKTASQLEFAEERWIPIPDDVLAAYIHCGRPTPLIRAHRLEEFLKTPARIYYKCEDLPPAGTFKTNTAIPQAYWAMKEGYKRTIFIGGSGTRTKFVNVFAARLFGLTPTVFMAREDCERNPDQVFALRNMFDADLVESPSNRTETGRKLLKENPAHPGSSITVEQELAEEARHAKDGVSIISSFLNHVLLTQTIIGLELKKQLESINEKPTVMVASVGAGSHFSGLISPFMHDYLKKKTTDMKFLGVESETSSKLTNGVYDYVSQPGPLACILVKAYRFSDIPQPPITARGIQVQTTAPILSLLRHLGLIDTRVYPKDERAIFEAARIFLQTEGRLPAPESAYSIRAVIDEALEAKKNGERPVIVTSVSGMAFLDFGEKNRYRNLASLTEAQTQLKYRGLVELVSETVDPTHPG